MKPSMPPFLFPHKGFTAFIFLASLLFVFLGIWQSYRLEWKQNLIQSIQHNTKQTPENFFALLKKNNASIPHSSSLTSSSLFPHEFHPASLKGHFLHNSHTFLVDRSPKGAPGVHVFMAFQPQTSNQESTPPAVLVNRGWIPFDVREHGGWIQLLPEKKDITLSSFTGTFRLFRPPSWVRNLALPHNTPATNTFFRLNPHDIQKKLNIKLNTQAYLVEELPQGSRKYPIPGPWTPNIPNNHLLYAITWFSLAILIVVLWGLYGISLGKNQKNQNHNT